MRGKGERRGGAPPERCASTTGQEGSLTAVTVAAMSCSQSKADPATPVIKPLTPRRNCSRTSPVGHCMGVVIHGGTTSWACVILRSALNDRDSRLADLHGFLTCPSVSASGADPTSPWRREAAPQGRGPLPHCNYTRLSHGQSSPLSPLYHSPVAPSPRRHVLQCRSRPHTSDCATPDHLDCPRGWGAGGGGVQAFAPEGLRKMLQKRTPARGHVRPWLSLYDPPTLPKGVAAFCSRTELALHRRRPLTPPVHSAENSHRTCPIH